MTDRWFNREAVEWVLYDAGAPTEQRLTLVAVASFTDADGRGAYPARSLVARLTGRSVRKSERDLAELVKRGLLLVGDWHLVMSIRADRRPNVYDLPDAYRLWLSRRVRLTPRTGRQDDASQGSTGRQERQNGASGKTERGVSVTPKEFLKNSRKRERAQPAAAQRAPAEENIDGEGWDDWYEDQFQLCDECKNLHFEGGPCRCPTCGSVLALNGRPSGAPYGTGPDGRAYCQKCLDGAA